MKPTPKLRWAQLEDESQIKLVLQQWWEENMSINLGWTGDIPIGLAKGEWRDVPTEAE